MHGGTGFDQAGFANRAVKIMYSATITRWQRKGYDDDVVGEESVFSFRWTGSSTLPRLHQEHRSTFGSRSGGCFISNTPDPSLVVATSNTGLKGAFGWIATMHFASFVSTYTASSIWSKSALRSSKLAPVHSSGSLISSSPASLAESGSGRTGLPPFIGHTNVLFFATLC